jgi:hypothetical protein
MVGALCSFPEGTAPGPSSFRASYFKEAVFCPSLAQASRTRTALTKCVNILAAGKAPPELAPLLSGANLFAANKKLQGEYRPIAVGEVLRRLTGKCLAFHHAPEAASHLNPHQLGVGTRSGGESIIHATQAILSDSTIPANNKWVLQIDFKNAFNCMDRTHLFEEVREHAPGLSAFVEWSYGSKSWLFFGDHILLSETGLQQGDPLASLLFSLGLQPIVLCLVEEVPGLLLIAWYLDDGVLGLKALRFLQDACPQIGLQLSLSLSLSASPAPVAPLPLLQLLCSATKKKEKKNIIAIS